MKAKLLFLKVCLALFFLSLTYAWAADVQLVVNELKIFSVAKLNRVAVGDPEIADVTVLSEKELMLIAKKAGTTSLIIWDESGQKTYNIVVIEQDLEKIAQKIRGLLASSDIRSVRVKTEGDKVYATGEVLTQRELDKVKGILTPFTNAVNLVQYKERQPLVEIDINVMEVAIDDMKKLGLDWSGSLPIKYTESSQIDGKAPKVWKVFDWDRTTIDAKWNFLIEEDKARTLANPKLITLSGKEASFLVGGETPYLTVPYTTGTAGTFGTTQVEWKQYGVNLKVNPQVTAKGEIQTIIKAEVSDIDWANAITYAGYKIPGLKKREVQTELFLNEGDIIFLAGLIKNEDSHNIDRLPWLSKVPILGELFKSTQFKDKRTELVISITPKIIAEEPRAESSASQRLKQEAKLAADSVLTYYGHLVQESIARSVVYPEAARQDSLEGVVEIDLSVLSTGELKEAKIKRSSGFSVLDQAALLAVQDVGSYPSFPAKISQQELRLSVPVVFKSYLKE